ncbi:MAG: CHAT domain-containing protein [bacterium]
MTKEFPRPSVFHIEGFCQGERLHITPSECLKGEVSTLLPYEEIRISKEMVETKCHELVKILNMANQRGKIRPDILGRLREIGQIFHDELLSPALKEKLRTTKATFLHLTLNEELVQIPWELLYDGEQFLCQRFNMGRTVKFNMGYNVKNKQKSLSTKDRKLIPPLKILILADPKKDLKGANIEGRLLRASMDQQNGAAWADFYADNILVSFIKDKIRNYDLVHFAGHADYHADNPNESGWQLSNGTFKAKDIEKMAGTGTMPSLIFSNACQSAPTEEWVVNDKFQDEIFGIANAFLLAGVKHYIGTFWEILDEPGSKFALKFYEYLFNGCPIGKAIRKARVALAEKYGEESIVWASYVLYGDPTFTYIDHSIRQPLEKEKEEPHTNTDPASIRTGEKSFFEARSEPHEGRRLRSIIARFIAGFIVVALVFLFWMYTIPHNKSEQQALTSYYAGNFQEAINNCQILEEKNPERSLSYLIRGNIHFYKGDRKQASSWYHKALEAKEGSKTEKADALLGLGRYASIEGNINEAMEYYQRAVKLAPDKGDAYLALAELEDRMGNHNEAHKLFNQAKDLSPHERHIEVIANEIEEKAALARNREKRERIDRLINEFLENPNEITPLPPHDGWSSFPLTVWVMDLENIGYSLQEGKERLITAGIKSSFINKSRAKIVDRSILDYLMEELKRGSSPLADRVTALSIGRLVAARIIVSGQVSYEGPLTQIIYYVTETETSEVTIVKEETFKGLISPSEIAQRISSILVDELNQIYPLQGKISEVQKDEIILNIGKAHGVKNAYQFKVVDTDFILEIKGILSEQSIAVVKAGSGSITPGLRVKFLDSSP